MSEFKDPNLNILHPIEKRILNSLEANESISINSLKRLTNLHVDQIRRGLEWLKFKNLIIFQNSNDVRISLGETGKQSIENGLPERRLVEAVKNGNSTIPQILKTGKVTVDEINIAISKSKMNKWIEIGHDKKNAMMLSILDDSKYNSGEEILLKKIKDNGNNIKQSQLSKDEIRILQLLRKRPDLILLKKIEELVSLTEEGNKIKSSLFNLEENTTLQQYESNVQALTSDMIVSGKWKSVKFREIDVEASTPLLFPGRTNPLTDLIEEIREAFVSLGFTEIEGNYVQSSFWNFDALFTPQDHAARDMQDTFYINDLITIELSTNKVIQNVAKSHLHGWHYKWDRNQAKKLVLRTHTTPVTLKYLSGNITEATKIFTIGRVFRNEKVSYKHLVEFNQIEGVVTDKNITLRDLMGIQIEFYKKIGIKKVKFWPTFFPYTEPSLQSMIYSERLGKWIELFGMGIFRPEVVGPLGIKNPVLAWGGGIERIAMLRYDISDVRDLYNNKLGWLRGMEKCLLLG